MYYLLSLLIGCITAVMVAFNGGLSVQYGVFSAAAIVHLVGTLFALGVLVFGRKKLNITKDIPLWMYSAGVIGVITTTSNAFSFGRISTTAIIALSLFGQTLTSVFIDCFGLFGMEKRRFEPYTVAGLAFAALGMGVMLTSAAGAASLAVALSLATGVVIVVSRTVNAALSARIGAMQGSFINHLTGLPVTLVILLLFGRNEVLFTAFALSPKVWIYMGGILGVTIVAMQNIAVPKVRATSLTLLIFVGQVFTGVLIDLAQGLDLASSTFIGGVLVAAGILLNLLIEYALKRRAAEGHPADK